MKKIILIIILLAILGGGIWYKTKDTQTPTEILTENPEFSDSSLGISFSYPKELEVSSDGQTVSIFHDIEFENSGACDMEGEGVTYPRLTDFNVQMTIHPAGLTETVKTFSSYIPEENFVDGQLIESPGYIDRSTKGSFSGFSIYEGAEGCGHTIYYFPVSENRTLIIIKESIQALSGIRSDNIVQEILKVPGAISREKSNEIFDQIVGSLKVN